jgi:hypothetical protein
MKNKPKTQPAQKIRKTENKQKKMELLINILVIVAGIIKFVNAILQ